MLKQAPEETSDKQEIPKVVTLIREFLAEVNLQMGRTENRFNLLRLEHVPSWRTGGACEKHIPNVLRVLIPRD
jgi:hypothetical protein